MKTLCVNIFMHCVDGDTLLVVHFTTGSESNLIGWEATNHVSTCSNSRTADEVSGRLIVYVIGEMNEHIIVSV